MKNRLMKRRPLLAFAITVSLTAVTVFSASPAAAVNQESTTHYYSCCYDGVDPDSTLMGEWTTHCDGHASHWGVLTPYWTYDSVPCP